MTKYSYLSLLLMVLTIITPVTLFSTDIVGSDLVRAIGYLTSPVILSCLSLTALDKHLLITTGQGL